MKEIVWNKMFAKICSKWRNISFERLINFAWNNYLGQLAECNCLGGNYLKGNYTESNYPLDNYPGAICPGANFSRGDRFGGSDGGDYPGDKDPGKQLCGGQFSFLGGHCPGSNCSGCSYLVTGIYVSLHFIVLSFTNFWVLGCYYVTVWKDTLIH